MQELMDMYGIDVVLAYMHHIRQNAAVAVRHVLKDVARRFNVSMENKLVASDFLDDGTEIRLSVGINPDDGSALFDFEGTGYEVFGNLNAPKAVTYSALIYGLRCLVNEDIPLNQGCLDPVTIVIPKGCVLDPSITAAVVGGNVLTSQRVTDVFLKAFDAAAASQGCMNNFTFGHATLGYYETIAGGAGAGPTWHGQSGVHTHMTNTRITDAEVLERRYPVLLTAFSLRNGSGGRGKFNGGDGVIREIKFLIPMDASILSERRSYRPYGLHDGGDGEPGLNLLLRKDGRVINLGGKNSFRLEKGDSVKILTPGGGAWGVAE